MFQYIKFHFGQRRKSQLAVLSTGANASFCNYYFAKEIMRETLQDLKTTDLLGKSASGELPVMGKIDITFNVFSHKGKRLKYKSTLFVLDTKQNKSYVVLGYDFIFKEKASHLSLTDDRLQLRNSDFIPVHKDKDILG